MVAKSVGQRPADLPRTPNDQLYELTGLRVFPGTEEELTEFLAMVESGAISGAAATGYLSSM